MAESDGVERAEPDGAKLHQLGNAEIAAALSAIADLLQIRGANTFRIRAYRNAVRTVETTSTPLWRYVDEGRDLQALPAIGKDMASYIEELVRSGRIRRLDELSAEIPPSLIELMRLPGVGPKRAKSLWTELGVQDIDQLEQAATQGAIASLKGFGERTQTQIVQSIAAYRQHSARVLISEADRLVQPLVDYMRRAPGVERVEAAGSYRRRCETVGDIDLLAIAAEAEPVMEHFVAYPQVLQVRKAGDTRGRVLLGSGLEVDLRIVGRESYGAALQYFTGSKEHNVKLRKRALGYGLRISEYGVFRVDPDEPAPEHDPWAGEYVAGAEEEDVYRAVELEWVPPEMREERGEIEAAAAGALPRLVEVGDIRGDLQMHSTWSDGRKSIEEMVSACVERGYEYVAITDHSKALPMIGGLDAKRLVAQWAEIDEVQARHPEIRILKSLEIDILQDGSLDLEDELIEKLDLVVVAIHSFFGQPIDVQTKRVVTALSHPKVQLFAHPTARMINRRGPIELDMETVLAAAVENGVILELNAHPHRLDLKDTHLFRARELGAKVAVNTDAHRIHELDNMHYGIEQARRAWLTPADVANTWTLEQLESFIRR